MNHRLFVLFLTAVLLIAAGHVGPSATTVRGETPANLLANPGFEGAFTGRHDPYTGIWANELSVAEDWELWYDNSEGCPVYDPGCNEDWYNRRPEYKAEEDTSRVRSGDKGQKFFTTYGAHTAGFYQSVGVPADSWVRFSIWVWAWSSQKDIPEYSFQPGDYRLSVGIDPTGGTDWQSQDILWSEPIVQHDAWVQLQIDAYTEADQVSVWTRGAPLWAVKHNDSYWDDGELIVLDKPPAPTPTPSPTSTPYPTPDPTPTGYEPAPCWQWDTVWKDDFTGAELVDWGQDPAEGSIDTKSGALWLRNGPSDHETFPLVWSEHPWPDRDDLRLSFRFAYENITAYGSTIGVGSAPYDGERILDDAGGGAGLEKIRRILDDPVLLDDPEETESLEEILQLLEGLEKLESTEDILRIHHREGEYSVQLLGRTVWQGTPGDQEWHHLALELAGTTYTVSVDGEEVGQGVSYWRPHSLYLGNPVIVWNEGRWSEVAIDDVHLQLCEARTLCLPLIMRR